MLMTAMTDTVTDSRFEPRELPYDYGALAPYLSEETMRFHHDKHYASYVAKLNELLLDSPLAGQPLEDILLAADGPLYNNAAQAWNHAFFFEQLSPQPQREPSPELRAAIDRDFGSFENFRKEFTTAATGLFGSGWAWLSVDKDGKLHITQESNAGNPLRSGFTPLLCFDVWEHAYYLDYQNRRADHLNALWNIIDWEVVEQRWK